MNCDLVDNNGVIHSFLPIENDKDSNDLFCTINYFINHKNEYEIPTNEQELDNRFFNAINKLNLPESARHALLNENDISKKWVIIVQYHNPTHLDINTESLLDDIKSVLIFIFQHNEDAIASAITLLNEIKIESVEWLKELYECRGINIFLDVFIIYI